MGGISIGSRKLGHPNFLFSNGETPNKNLSSNGKVDECDWIGSKLCKNNEIFCFNGGVCVLISSDFDDECIPTCKCKAQYMGPRCEFSTAIYTGTVGLAIGLFVALLLIIFIVIAIWYFCCRKRSNNLSRAGQNGKPHERCYLGNTIKPQLAENGHRLQIEQNTHHDQELKPYTLHSYSVYDNINCTDPISAPIGLDNMRESAYLLSADGIDSGKPIILDQNSNPLQEKQSTVVVLKSDVNESPDTRRTVH